MDSVNRSDNPLNLAEALAWLDFCLGESEAALQAVKAAAVKAQGMTCQRYHDICETAAKLVTFRARCGRWLKRGSS